MSGNQYGKRVAWGYAGYELRPNYQDLDPNLPEKIVCSGCKYELPQRDFSATQLGHLNDALDTQGPQVLGGEGDFAIKCCKCIEAAKRIEFKCRFCKEWKPEWWFARSQHAHAFRESHSLPICMTCQDENFDQVVLGRERVLPALEGPEEEVPGTGLSSRTVIKSPNLILDWDENEGLDNGGKSPPNLILDWDENEGLLSSHGKSPDLPMDSGEDEGHPKTGKELVLREEPLSMEEIEEALKKSQETEKYL
ncbi:hypothetical protein N7486_007225 [Penicillium sp. IBT 16267x]|nr:hypothetical protein N7486_007225 [Penicillium sp. IBT 16267x]